METKKKTDVKLLMKYIASSNICDLLDENEIGKIGFKCSREFEIDEASRNDWKHKVEKGMELALLEQKEKNFPWPGAANVKHPIITTASIQFASRAYPEIIRAGKVVKAQTVGADDTGQKELKAKRISEHMSWQLTEEMPEWSEDTDRLLHALPIVGCCFKKTYFCPVKQRNVSEYISALDLVIHYKAKSLETVPRISHEFPIYENEMWEMVAEGIWRDCELPFSQDAAGDESPQHSFVEQHCFIDLDEDGYQEPYVVTFHKDSSKVVRIVARYDEESVEMKGNKLIRIVPKQHFTKFSFLPNPDGGFYDIGLGVLLQPLNESINTTLNELLDAGALANAGGGFISRGIRIKGGNVRFNLGEWKFVDTGSQDLRAGIVPLPIREPSQVLFGLLGFLVEAAREVGSVSDLMAGDQIPANAPATTTIAMIEQGMKIFNGIYQRVYRSLTQEYKKLYELNAKYLDEQSYFRVLDEQQAVSRLDYETETYDVRPVGEPSLSSDSQRMARLNALMALTGRYGINEDELTRRYLEAIDAPNAEVLIIPPDQRPQPGPDALLIDAQSRAETEVQKREHSEAMFRLEMEAKEAEIEKLKTTSALNVAKASSEEPQHDVEDYKRMIEELTLQVENQTSVLNAIELQRQGDYDEQLRAFNERGISGVEEGLDDSEGI